MPSFNDHSRLKRQQNSIQDWVRKSGAVAAIWGEIHEADGKQTALLHWTGSELPDSTEDRQPWVPETTIAFPPMPWDRASAFLRVWTKLQAKFYYRDRAVPSLFEEVLRITHEDKKLLSEIEQDLCDASFSFPCRRLGRLQLTAYLLDNQHDHLFCGDAEKRPLCPLFLHRATDLELGGYSNRGIDSPLALENLFYALEYAISKARQGHISNDALITYLLDGRALFPGKFDALDASVEREYPHVNELLDLARASYDVGMAEFVRQYRPEGKRPIKDLPGADFTEYEKRVRIFGDAVIKISERPDVSYFEQGRFRNRFGTMLANLAEQDDAPVQKKALCFVKRCLNTAWQRRSWIVIAYERPGW
jgi:hypothetical protein